MDHSRTQFRQRQRRLDWVIQRAAYRGRVRSFPPTTQPAVTSVEQACKHVIDDLLPRDADLRVLEIAAHMPSMIFSRNFERTLLVAASRRPICLPEDVEVLEGTVEAVSKVRPEYYDLVADLNCRVLVGLLTPLSALLKPGGLLVLCADPNQFPLTDRTFVRLGLQSRVRKPLVDGRLLVAAHKRCQV